MEKEIQKDQYDKIVQELESDAASLASMSALELTDYICSSATTFQAVERLAEVLCSPRAQDGTSWPRILLSDPIGEVALVDAISAVSAGRIPVDTNALVQESDKIAIRLRQFSTGENRNLEEAKMLREFCLELFDSISGLSEPLYQPFPQDLDTE